MQSTRSTIPCRRSGLTVIEVMVGVAIISLLLALLLPAVQSVREASRKMMCQNNLRQLSHSLIQYHDTHQSLPPSHGSSDHGLTFLFPFLELPGRSVLIESGVQHLSRLECPSDGELSLVPKPVSYSINESPGQGSGSAAKGPFGRMIIPTGYDTRAAVRVSEILDGSSNTAAISENLVSRAGGDESEANKQPVRYGFFIRMTPVSVETQRSPLTPSALSERSLQTDQSISQCLDGPRTFLPQPDPMISSWGNVQNGPVGYSHWWPPNAPTCGPTGMASDGPFISFNQRAASNHANSVNVAFLDGHVRCINERIDRLVWRAIGTRDGSEQISEGAY